MEDLYSTIGTFERDNLCAGQDIPVLTKGITLAKGQGIINRGTVLGIITESGLLKPVDSSKTDGTQTANCILTDTVNTGDSTATEDSTATAYISGLFNASALTFGGSDTYAKHQENLRSLGIYLQNNIAY
jgi:hypothetical protein